MTDTTTNTDVQDTEMHEESGTDMKADTPGQKTDEEPRATPGNFREASYVVLFIAAVFIINAMETGSYRTPWPVAVVTLISGLGLFGYSWYLQSQSKI